jgi:RNA polymerase sigma-70 factor (ECF subfamily)
MQNVHPAMAFTFTSSETPILQENGPQTAPAQLSMDAVYARFAPYVAAIASRILGRQVEVQDVVQDVFAVALRGLARREDTGQIKRWLATVTVRHATAKLRERALWQLFDKGDATDYVALADPGATPEERQMIEEVYRVLDNVSAKDRVAWVLRYVEGEQLEAVAELCGCSLATAKRRIAAAHDKITRHVNGGRS